MSAVIARPILDRIKWARLVPVISSEDQNIWYVGDPCSTRSRVMKVYQQATFSSSSVNGILAPTQLLTQ